MSDQTGGPEPVQPEGAAMPAPPTGGAMPAPPTGDAASVPPGLVPPEPESFGPGDPSESASSTGWPSSAKTWVAILAVLAVLGGAAAAVGFSQASSADDDKSDVQADLDAANARADAAEEERDDVSILYAESVAEVTDVTAERDAAVAERDAAVAANETLTADLAAETARADEAEAALEEISGLFPVSVDTSLEGLDVAGSYSITFTEAYCDFVTGCGTTPNSDSAVIGVTPEGFLDFTVDGILEAGLFAVNGGLYGITDSETAIPPCGDVPRRGRVTITIFPADITVAADGTRTVNTLEASITLDAPTLDDCPSGLVFWGAVLTPTG